MLPLERTSMEPSTSSARPDPCVRPGGMSDKQNYYGRASSCLFVCSIACMNAAKCHACVVQGETHDVM